MHQCISPADVPCHGQHQPQRVLGHRYRICARSVHHRYSLAGSGIQINVVQADPRAAPRLPSNCSAVTTVQRGSRNKSTAEEEIFSATTTFMSAFDPLALAL